MHALSRTPSLFLSHIRWQLTYYHSSLYSSLSAVYRLLSFTLTDSITQIHRLLSTSTYFFLSLFIYWSKQQFMHIVFLYWPQDQGSLLFIFLFIFIFFSMEWLYLWLLWIDLHKDLSKTLEPISFFSILCKDMQCSRGRLQWDNLKILFPLFLLLIYLFFDLNLVAFVKCQVSTIHCICGNDMTEINS